MQPPLDERGEACDSDHDQTNQSCMSVSKRIRLTTSSHKSQSHVTLTVTTPTVTVVSYAVKDSTES